MSFLKAIAAACGLAPKPAAPDTRPAHLASDLLPGLTLEGLGGDYVTHAAWRGRTVEVCLAADTEDERAQVLEAAHTLWGDQQTWARAVNARAVEDLLELKNSGWEEDDATDVVLTREQFLSRMTLETVSIEADGDFQFFFNDDNMFFGHFIIVHGSLAEGVTRAELAG